MVIILCLFVALHERRAKGASAFTFALSFAFTIFPSIVSALRLIAIRRRTLKVLQE